MRTAITIVALLLLAWIHNFQQSPDLLAEERYLAAAIDWSQAGLVGGQVLLASGDTSGAIDFLLTHHQSVDRDWLADTWDSTSQQDIILTANDLLVDTVFLYNMRTEMPKSPSGGWLWDYTGPTPDDEFGYSLNGHKYLPTLFHQYQWTSDQKYLNKLFEILDDWITQHPLPRPGDSVYLVYNPANRLDYRDLGEVEWRTLEMGHRLGTSWPHLYFSLSNNSLFGRQLRIKMLASLARQADFLQIHHKRGHNWTTMEMNGLAIVGLALPEFQNASAWAEYALQTMQQEINQQVYQDGAQVELAGKTQWVALRRFESIADNFARAGRVLDHDYRAKLEEMYNYLAYSIRPDGHLPLNSDADREDLTRYINLAADKFERPDWQWITSNGRRGELPKLGPKLVFPWAGVGVFRSGWTQEDHWIFFDAGPYGTGHQHRDKLHLSLSAFGQDLLVDAGRYTHENYFSFDPQIWRGYFRSSHSHNVMLVNGKGQKAYTTKADKPLQEGKDYWISDNLNIVRGSFTGGFEGIDFDVEHRRSLYYLENRYIVVVDEVLPGQPCTVDFLWHFAPTANVVENNLGLTATFGDVDLQLLVSDPSNLEFDKIKGQTSPSIQGWYSETYGKKEENFAAIYSHKISDQYQQAWLFAPRVHGEKSISWSVVFSNSHCYVSIDDGDQKDWKLPLFKEEIVE